MQLREYFVYMMANHSRTLYTGVTRDLARRVSQHKEKVTEGFTKRYSIRRLVYFERYSDIHLAIAREKQIKGWRREKKVALVEAENPHWEDLSADW